MGFTFHILSQRYGGPITSAAPMATMENLFLFLGSGQELKTTCSHWSLMTSGQGNRSNVITCGSPSKSGCIKHFVNAIVVNCKGGHNDNVSDSRFKLRGKRSAKKAYAESDRKCTTVTSTLHFHDDDNCDG